MFVYSYDSLGGYMCFFFFHMKLLGKLYEYADNVAYFSILWF